MPVADGKTPTTKQDIHFQALEEFRIASSYESENHEQSKEDIQFVYNVEGGQWDAQVKKDRDKRPAITINKLRKFVAQIANQERVNRIKLKVIPVDSKADPVIAQHMEGLIRNIEYNSQAEETYADAGERAAAGGFAYWRILTEYADNSFEQDIKIQYIQNPYNVYLDPSTKKKDKSDARYGFIVEAMSKDQFVRDFPNAEIQDWNMNDGEYSFSWWQEDVVYVAEYFKVDESKTEKLFLIKDPETGVQQTVKDRTKEEIEEAGLEILDSRDQVKRTVKWYKMSGAEILEETDWPGKYIPIIEVVGDSVNYLGQEYKRSLITDAKDPQNMYNYWVTSLTETVALAPKAPYMVTPETIAGFENMWETASDENYFYLLYNREGDKPTKELPAQVPTGAMTMLQLADADIKDIIGWYEGAMGEKSNERSGKALERRKQYSASGTFHFPDNLRRAVVYTGRQLVDLIPKIYTTEKIVRITNEKGESGDVALNQPIPGSKAILNDLSIGRYDIEIGTGTWDSLKRQESAQQMIELTQYAGPEFGAFVADLIAKRLDWDDTAEFEERVKMYQQFIMQKMTAGSQQGGKPK